MNAASPRSFPSNVPSQDDVDTSGSRLSPRNFVGKSADISVNHVSAVDVWKVANEFPARWAEFLRVAYHSDLILIQNTFRVCERTARRWLKGNGGVRAPHHVVANHERPEDYRRIVLAEAA